MNALEPAFARRRITAHQVMDVVAAAYGIARRDILSARKSRAVVRPRQVAMHLTRQLTLLSYPEIGRMFGRDHATVMHGCMQIDMLLSSDPSFARLVAEIRDRAITADPAPADTVEALLVGAVSDLLPRLIEAARRDPLGTLARLQFLGISEIASKKD